MLLPAPNLCAATSLQSKSVQRLLLLASISVFLAGAAHADATRDALSEIARCAAVADASERLQCFDAAVPGAPNAVVPKAEDFGKPPQPPRSAEIAQITAAVLELARTLRGRAVFVLDNGQTWRQLDADATEVREPPPGKVMRITIERGMLDSYNLTVEGRNGLIKVRRLK